MPQLEVSPVVAIEEEEGKAIPTAKLLEVLSRMGVQLRPAVSPEDVFTGVLPDYEYPEEKIKEALKELPTVRGSESSSLPSRSRKSINLEPFAEGRVRVDFGEAAEGQARGSVKRIAIGEARRTLGQVVTEAHYTDKDYIIERHGKPEAAVIGIKDYERLQRLENERDVRLLQKAKRKARGFVSAEQLVSDYEKRFGEKISTPSEGG